MPFTCKVDKVVSSSLYTRRQLTTVGERNQLLKKIGKVWISGTWYTHDFNQSKKIEHRVYKVAQILITKWSYMIQLILLVYFYILGT